MTFEELSAWHEGAKKKFPFLIIILVIFLYTSSDTIHLIQSPPVPIQNK